MSTLPLPLLLLLSSFITQTFGQPDPDVDLVLTRPENSNQNSIILTCTIVPAPLPDTTVTYEFLHTGSEFSNRILASSDTSGSSNYPFEVEGNEKNLLYIQLTIELEGEFYCRADGMKSGNTLMLFFYPEPDRTISLQHRYQVGTTGSLPCVFRSGYLGKREYHWYKDDVMLNGEFNEVLVLDDISPSDEGVYRCGVVSDPDSSIFYQAEQSAMEAFNVEVYKPASITSEFQDMVEREGRDVTLTCDADGIPAPTVSWWKNGKRETADNPSSSVLKMMALESAILTCQATQPDGTIAEKHLLLTVLSKPRSIQLLQRHTTLDEIVYFLEVEMEFPLLGDTIGFMLSYHTEDGRSRNPDPFLVTDRDVFYNKSMFVVEIPEEHDIPTDEAFTISALLAVGDTQGEEGESDSIDLRASDDEREDLIPFPYSGIILVIFGSVVIVCIVCILPCGGGMFLIGRNCNCERQAIGQGESEDLNLPWEFYFDPSHDDASSITPTYTDSVKNSKPSLGKQYSSVPGVNGKDCELKEIRSTEEVKLNIEDHPDN